MYKNNDFLLDILSPKKPPNSGIKIVKILDRDYVKLYFMSFILNWLLKSSFMLPVPYEFIKEHNIINDNNINYVYF